MHEHDVCEHELKYCKICDVVYCENCKKEWKYYIAWYNQPYKVTYTDEHGTPGTYTTRTSTGHSHDS